MTIFAHKAAVIVGSAALLALADPAWAIEYNRVLPDRSALVFVSKQMNVPVEGRFKSFRGQLAFDPAKPVAAKAELDIDMNSVDVGLKEANDEAVGKDWFNVKAFPTAKFVSTSIRPLGGDKYEIAGKMTIKGKTRDLTTPATFRQDGNAAVMEGTFVIKRADYGIGEGMWADFGTVANEVQIKFRLAAAAAAARK